MTQLIKDMETHRYFTTLMDAPLAAPTKKQYRHKLLGLVEMMNKPFDWIIDHPQETVEVVKDMHSAEQTRKAYIAAVKALLKYNDETRLKHPGKSEEWHIIFSVIDNNILQGYIDQKATAKDNENWVTWDKVLEKEKELASTSYASKDHLLIAMYSLIEPMRQDYGAVRIYRIEPDNNEGNYIVMDSRPRIILNEYKTANAYGKKERELPQALAQIITKSLENTPREYLFMNTNGEPYKDDSYTKFTNRALERIFSKKFTVSMMRHSFVNTKDFNDTAKVFENSKLMGHSVKEHLLYKKKIETM